MSASSASAYPASSANLKYWDDGKYFESWYAVCRSEDLKVGAVIGRDFLNTRIVLYRDPAGAAIAQSGYCPHFGADLSLGAIDNGELRCAYHHWRFARDGRCSHVPNADRLPASARLSNYPVAESFGLVFVYNGDEPRCAPPALLGVSEDEVLYEVSVRPEQPVDCWIPPSNSVDFQHLLSIHHFPSTAIPDELDVGPMHLGYKVNLFLPDGEGRVTGCNTFALRNLMPIQWEHFTIFTSNALRPGVTQPFFVTAVRRPADDAELQEAQARLKHVTQMSAQLYEEDELILNTIRIRPRGQAKLVAHDQGLARFLNYIEALPRTAPHDA